MQTVKADLHGPERQLEPLSDRQILEILQVAKPNQLGVAWGKSRQRVGQQPPALVLSLGTSVDDLLRHRLSFPFAALAEPGAQPQGLVARDAPDPGIRGVVGVTAGARTPCAQERLLRRIFGVLTRAQHLQGGCERRAPQLPPIP